MESTLSIQLSDLAKAVGHYLGFGRTAANWNGWQAATPYVPSGADTAVDWIMECVQQGYTEFLYPKLVEEGAATIYEWSFLTPRKQLQLVAGQTTYDLEDGFRDLVGEFTYQPSDMPFIQIQERGIGEVQRVLQQTPQLSTKPQICAIVPKLSDGAIGQRWAVVFAPIPDANYLLDARWSVLPQALSNNNPWPYGGMVHGNTIRLGCLAYAEVHFNDEPDGPYAKKYAERLRASIAADRELRPAVMGYNADRSDAMEGGGSWDPWAQGQIYATQTVGALFNGSVP